MLRSTWEHRNRWRGSPLQDVLFNTKNAGEELFQRLKRLRSEEVREVYYVCLGLGFSGQYFLEEDGPKLTRERLEQTRQLSMPVESVRDIKRITPQPYEVPAPENGLPQPPWTRLLLRVGVALLVLIPLALFTIYKFMPVGHFQFTMVKAGNGSGTVTSTPVGIHCGPDCTAAYARRTTLTLTAIPDPGSGFSGWSGDPGCASGTVAMTANKSCTATFNLDRPLRQLTVAKAGSGSGTVISTPAGIHCGADCAEGYTDGTLVTLQAVADPESVFVAWSGDADCTRGQVSLTATKTCTATFQAQLTAAMILSRLAGQFPCARISIDGMDAGTGSVHLGGRVASEAQRSDVSRVVQDIKGVTKVTETLHVIPRPFCAVIELLEPFKERNEQQGLGLAASLNKPGSQPIYVQDDRLVVNVKMPSGFESYLYVDYYGTDAVVNHMFPDPKMLPKSWTKTFRANSSFTVDGGGEPWKIAEPFGLELVTVIASKTPLVAWPRDGDEPAEAYLNELRRVLPKDPATANIAAVFYLFTTKEP
jgi:hypothetical protein